MKTTVLKISTLAKLLNEVIAEKGISFHRHSFSAVTAWLRENFGDIRSKQAARDAIAERIESGRLPEISK